MAGYDHIQPDIALRSGVMQRVRLVYALRICTTAAKRTGFVLLSLLALTPAFEMMRFFSIERVMGNMPFSEGVREVWAFSFSAFKNTELTVQLVSGLAITAALAVIAFLVRDFYNIRRIS